MNTATEVLSEFGINVMSLNDEFNTQLLHAMQQYAEQHCELLKNNYIYWESRCQAAEVLIDTQKTFPIEAYKRWKKLKTRPFGENEQEEKPNKPETKLAKECDRDCEELKEEVERLKGLLYGNQMEGL